MIAKILLISVVPMTVILAAVAAREKTPRRGLRVAIYGLFVFHACYLFGLLYVLPRLGM